jgi:hypothetical protein
LDFKNIILGKWGEHPMVATVFSCLPFAVGEKQLYFSQRPAAAPFPNPSRIGMEIFWVEASAKAIDIRHVHIQPAIRIYGIHFEAHGLREHAARLAWEVPARFASKPGRQAI